ncbi:MAG: hypothetical protein RQ826_10980 [Xanthomonadales bacterium]|nr:hypothetical protein [Xanthomonadales bacterium]
MIRIFGAYLLSLIAGYALASVIATQSVVARLQEMGVDVAFMDRLDMTLKDLQGLAGSLLPMLAFGYLIAFLTAALLSHRKPSWRTPLFALAGAAALVSIHLMLNMAFGVTPIAVARTSGGLLAQAAAGAVGAWLFAYLTWPAAR